MSDARVKIDVAAGLIEIEGNKDFVSTYLDKLLPLVEASGLGTAFRAQENDGQELSRQVTPEQTGAESSNGEPPKKKKRGPKRPPAGTSGRDRIMTLRADGFFKEHRSPSDIVAGLLKKGWTHNTNQVSASLTTMFNNQDIQRTKSGDGVGFSYFWDRD